ncbi:tubulin binding cofactor A [Pterulicium gracile]|uniref:Tubulin-specific chaperone A n=1 Tax=Pterulicium gracile TaxID=1884261 RepID=A0A5C3QXS7_9AGAR|nr:tubulin binding cofactor A [Pterula gracilis]
MSPTQRQLVIKSGSAKRLHKEHIDYQDELGVAKAKVDELVAKHGEDEWEVKNARRMLDESHRMIPDSEERLAKATEELRNLVTAAMKDPELSQSTQFAEAKKALETISA